MSGDTISIEQRLQDQARFLLFSIDDAVILGVPMILGMLSRRPIEGIFVGFVLWQIWKRLKGDGGLTRLSALAYWYLPKPLSICRGFPDSGITEWRG